MDHMLTFLLYNRYMSSGANLRYHIFCFLTSELPPSLVLWPSKAAFVFALESCSQNPSTAATGDVSRYIRSPQQFNVSKLTVALGESSSSGHLLLHACR